MIKIVEGGYYKCMITSNKDGLQILSMVEQPAIEIDMIKLSADKDFLKLSILDEDKRIVIGPALIPDLVIPRIEKGVKFYISFDKQTIFDSLVKMVEEDKDNNVNLQHTGGLIKGVTLFEKFITDPDRVTSVKNFEHVPMGTLFFSGKVDDDKVWQDVKMGKINGWSIEGGYDLIRDIQLSDDDVLTIIENIL